MNPALAAVERKLNLKAESDLRRKRDDEWSAAAQAETAALEARRGVELLRPDSKPGEHRKPMRRLRGLNWLLRYGKLGEDASLANQRAAAGDKYGADYEIATTAPLKSCMASLQGRVGGNPIRQTAETKMFDAAQRLYAARGAGLHGNKALILVCDALLGMGETPLSFADNDRPQAIRYEAQVLVALDMLVDFYDL